MAVQPHATKLIFESILKTLEGVRYRLVEANLTNYE